MKNESNNMFLTVIMPALNKEKNIQAAIHNTLNALADFNIHGELIKLIRHDTPQG